MGFSQIRPNPTISSEKKKCIFKKKSSFRQEFSSSRQEFPIPRENSRFRRRFFSNFDAFFNSRNRSDPTNANHHRKPNRPIFPTVGFGLLHPSTRRWWIESGLGRKPTRPDPWIVLSKIIEPFLGIYSHLG